MVYITTETRRMPSAEGFAECTISSTRQNYYLPSAYQKALGKQTTLGGRKLCRVPATWHSAKPHFTECLNQDTRRTHLCRVPRGQHSATSVTCATQARTRPLQRGRRYSLPSASQCALGKDNHVRRTRPLPVATLLPRTLHCTKTVTVMICRVPGWGHSAKLFVPSASCPALGKAL